MQRQPHPLRRRLINALSKLGQQRTNSELRDESMKVMDWLRKGFGFVLLSMGVSRPAPKPRTQSKPESPYNKEGNVKPPADGG
jgi:hypothetical protein